MWLFNVIIAAHLILLATVKCTCTEKSKSVLQDHVLQEIMVISKTNLLYRKFRDTLRILCSKGLYGKKEIPWDLLFRSFIRRDAV